jgi:hypothetical protein
MEKKWFLYIPYLQTVSHLQGVTTVIASRKKKMKRKEEEKNVYELRSRLLLSTKSRSIDYFGIFNIFY